MATRRAGLNGNLTLAVSLGTPSPAPDVWRKDVRRARERVGKGQVLIVSVLGTTPPGGDREALVADYARVAQTARLVYDTRNATAGVDASHVYRS